MFFFVSDLFVEDMIGGGELTSEAFISQSLIPIKKIHSSEITYKLINENKNKNWIFGNFAGISHELLIFIAKNLSYSVIEYDYKYCKYRSSHKHVEAEGACGCEATMHGKIVSIFLRKAKQIFWMSENQKREYTRLFPFLGDTENVILSSSFKEDITEYIKSLDIRNKDEKFLILNSSSWIKGTQDCVEYAKKNEIEYELVGGLSHKDLLKKLAKSKGLIFLPKGYDTCPRIVIEAKLLGCELVLNDYVQHKDESWFNNDIFKYIKNQKNMFFEKCLNIKIAAGEFAEKNKFHIIIPVYNSEKFISKTIRSIKKQNYKNYTVTIIDDLSTDKTREVIRSSANGDGRFKFIQNKTKKYALQGVTTALSKIRPKDNDIVLILDGDDWLSSTDVLSFLNKVYCDDKDLLLTYGSYMEYPSGRVGIEPSEYPRETIKNNNFRKDVWRASHPKTFKYKLWKHIDQKDFLDKDGEFYKMSYDQALMLPMLEMAHDKIKFLPQVLHIYNKENPLHHNFGKVRQQHETMLRIRNRKPYLPRF